MELECLPPKIAVGQAAIRSEAAFGLTNGLGRDEMRFGANWVIVGSGGMDHETNAPRRC